MPRYRHYSTNSVVFASVIVGIVAIAYMIVIAVIVPVVRLVVVARGELVVFVI